MLVAVAVWLAAQEPDVDVVAPSPAAEAPDAVDREGPGVDVAALLERARGEIRDLEYDAAHGTLLEVLNVKGVAEDALVDAHSMSGEVCVILGRDVEARGHYLWLLRRDPDLALPPEAPAKVATFFSLIREEVLADRERATPPAVGPKVPPPEPRHVDRLRSGLFAGIGSGCANVAVMGGGGAIAGPLGVFAGTGCGACLTAGAVAAGASSAGAELDGTLAIPVLSAATATVVTGGVAGLLAGALSASEDEQRGSSIVFGVAAAVAAGVVSGVSAALLINDPPDAAAPPTTPERDG